MIDAPFYAVRPSILTATSSTPPGSKSITNRALLLAAIAEGASTLRGALDAEDTRVMLEALQTLGIEASYDAATRVATVMGQGGRFPNKKAELYVGNSGTTTRFLTAALAFADDGEYRIDGKPRMRERPVGDLLDALHALGCDVVSEQGNACPPLTVRGRKVAENPAFPEKVTIAANVSSQFLSGLLMSAPLARRAFEIEVDGALASRPYVEMTLECMRAFGVDAQSYDDCRRFGGFTKGGYHGRDYVVEPDASAASYFLALPAILGGTMTIPGLSRHALQGDVAFVDILEKMGCVATWRDDSVTIARPTSDGKLAPLHGVDVDMNGCSDLVQTLAVVALFADSKTTVRNVANIRVKETDRLAAVTRELRKLGAVVEEYDDGLSIIPGAPLHGASIATYDDHRMAMSFALSGLRIPDVVIQNPGCVVKTYPDYFEDLERATTPIITSAAHIMV